MISINDLKFVATMLNFAAATLAVAELDDVSAAGFPTLLDFMDSTSTPAWLDRPPLQDSNAFSALL